MPCAAGGEPFGFDDLERTGLRVRIAFEDEAGARCVDRFFADAAISSGAITVTAPGELIDVPSPPDGEATTSLTVGWDSPPWQGPEPGEGGSFEVDLLLFGQTYVSGPLRSVPGRTGFLAGGYEEGVSLDFSTEGDDDDTLAGELAAPVDLGTVSYGDSGPVDVVVESLAFRGVPVTPAE